MTTSVVEKQGPEQRLGRHRVATWVAAVDPGAGASLASQLRAHGDLVVVDEVGGAGVGIAVLDEVDDDGSRLVRDLLRAGCPHVVVVSGALDEAGVARAVDAGACAVLRRLEATPERLATLVTAVEEGGGTLPPDLLGSLLSRVGRFQGNLLQPRGLLVNGFTAREIEVLRLVADGRDTAEVAEELAYSERTVKNVLHDVTTRFGLRNRCHAVAFALRAGVI